MKKAIFFDLDGTLLSLNVKEFMNVYLGTLCNKFNELGYDKDLIKNAILNGIKAIIYNDGNLSNEDIFWLSFEKETNIKKDEVIVQLNEYYKLEFKKAKIASNVFEEVNEIIVLLKEKGYLLILATNPLFPKLATYQRIEWAGLNINDFNLITTYENSFYAKPNPLYFKDILNKLNLNINEVLMVGNNQVEDGAFTLLNGDLAIITNELENPNHEVKSVFKGTLKEFIDYIKVNL